MRWLEDDHFWPRLVILHFKIVIHDTLSLHPRNQTLFINNHVKAMQSSFISSIKECVSHKNYWLLVWISAGVGLFTYLIATAIWYKISGVNWLTFPIIGLFCIVPFVLGTLIAAPFIKTKRSLAFFLLYIAITISFLIIMLPFYLMSDVSTEAWIYLFITGWCIITVLPVFILCFFAKKLLK